jgi:hypothetical protein
MTGNELIGRVSAKRQAVDSAMKGAGEQSGKTCPQHPFLMMAQKTQMEALEDVATFLGNGSGYGRGGEGGKTIKVGKVELRGYGLLDVARAAILVGVAWCVLNTSGCIPGGIGARVAAMTREMGLLR